jgi:hypothetical protein
LEEAVNDRFGWLFSKSLDVDVRTQSQQIEQALYQERVVSRLSSFFAHQPLMNPALARAKP